MTQISGSERAHQTTGDASEGGHLPDRSRLSRLPARRVVDHAARIGRPARTIVIDVVFGESERRSASQQPHPDLTLASGDRDERDRPAVGRQCRRFLESDEIGQSLQLHGPRRGARLDDRTQHPTRSGCEHQTGDREQPCHRLPHRSTSGIAVAKTRRPAPFPHCFGAPASANPPPARASSDSDRPDPFRALSRRRIAARAARRQPADSGVA